MRSTRIILWEMPIRISPDEIYEKFRPELLENEDIMLHNIVSLVELNKSRKEVDNISAAVIRTCREG